MNKTEAKDLDTSKDGNSSETDDATDDEGPGSSQQSTLSSKYVERKVPQDEHYILKSLSIPLNKDADSELPNLIIRIRCGKQYIRISRIRLKFCFSRIPPAEKKRILSLLPNIGACLTSEFSLDTTHLVTPDLISTAKTICAWTCNVPIVTMSFIDALLERTKGDDPFPNEEYCSAIGSTPLNLKILQKPGSAQGFLKGYTCLSLQRTEAEIMLRCGGAEIIPLYREQNGKIDWTFWQNKQWWEELQKRRLKNNATIVWLDSTSRKALKGKQYLSKLMKRQETEDDNSNNNFVLKCINQTCVANALTSLSTPKDIRGEDIPEMASTGNGIQNLSFKNSTQTLVSPLNPNHENQRELQSNFDDQNEIERKDELSDSMPNRPRKRTKTDKLVQTLCGDISGTVDRKGNTDEQQSCDDALQSIKCANKESEQFQAKKDKTVNETQTGTGWMCSSSHSQPKPGKGKEKALGKERREESLLQQNEQIDQQEVVCKNMKSLLSSTNDGWLVAAPLGNARTEHKARMEENTDFDETYPSHAVITEICRGLVVKSYKAAEEGPKVSTGNRLDNNRKKDFKRFKKNIVISSSKIHKLSQVQLISVLPKESEKQIQLMALEKEKKEENERDIEFMEDDIRTKPRKRKANSIQQYFGSDNKDVPKRGSARRRVGRR